MSESALFSLDNHEWKIFLAKFYTYAKQQDPNINLDQIYPIAQRKYLMDKRNSGLHLNLIANPKKFDSNKK
jgi:hypothetical protein